MCLIKIFIFCAQSFNFDQTYLNTGLKTQNVEGLSLDLIFHYNFWWNIKSFSKQNSKLRIHSKPDRNQSKLTVLLVTQHMMQCRRTEMHIKKNGTLLFSVFYVDSKKTAEKLLPWQKKFCYFALFLKIVTACNCYWVGTVQCSVGSFFEST